MMEVIINGVSCPVSGELPVSLNFQVNTIKTLKDRKGAFSKSVTIPGSPEVKRLFTQIFEINLDVTNNTSTQFNPDFNPNIKTPCYVYDGQTPVMVGFARLMEIKRKFQQLGDVEFIVQITGDNADLFTLLNDYYLTDCDLSAFDHTYNRATILASWTAAFGQGYVYPQIDFGQNNTTNWNLTHHYPNVYAKQYIDSMFGLVSRQYISGFFTSSPFENLAVPFNRDKFALTTQQMQDRAVLEEIGTTQTFAIDSVASSVNIAPLIFDTEIYDISNQYIDTGIDAGKIVIGTIGSYTFRCSLTLRFTLTSGTGNPAGTLFIVYDNGSTQTAIGVTPFSFASFGVDYVVEVFFTSPILMQPGHKIWVRLDPHINDPLGTALGAVDIKAPSYFQGVVGNPALVEGSPVSMAAVIPQNIRCSDFLMWLCQKFNLMIEPSRDNPKKYVIEPAGVFYGNDFIDMTEQLDVSSDFVQKPIGLQTGKRFIYRDKADTDYHNKLYSDTYGEVYGQRVIDVNNDFSTAEQITETGFSPTVLVGYTGHNRIYSAIVNGNTSAPTKHNIRLLYYGGLVPCSPDWIMITNAGNFNHNTYPYVGHLDSINTPTFDLNFGIPQALYYPTTVYTNGNCYNLYHSDFVSEITDPGGKMVEAMFNVKPVHISTLSFGRLWYVGNTLYRLQSIEDYDPVKRLLSKVTLLKVKRGVLFSPRTAEIFGGEGSNIDGEAAPVTIGYVDRAPVVEQSRYVGNVVDSNTDRIFINGSGNRVGSGCNNITIDGNNNTIQPGVTGVTLIQCEGLTIGESDAVYINNHKHHP
jgi:hypothetical protein